MTYDVLRTRKKITIWGPTRSTPACIKHRGGDGLELSTLNHQPSTRRTGRWRQPSRRRSSGGADSPSNAAARSLASKAATYYLKLVASRTCMSRAKPRRTSTSTCCNAMDTYLTAILPHPFRGGRPISTQSAAIMCDRGRATRGLPRRRRRRDGHASAPIASSSYDDALIDRQSRRVRRP